MQDRAASARVSDDKLVEGIRARESRSLELLFKAYGGFVHGLSLRILREPAEAEEVVQDVFLYVWRQIERFDKTRGNLPSWLVTLTRSRSIDRVRARTSRDRRRDGRQEAAEMPDPAQGARDPLEDAVLGERSQRLRQCLLKLPEKQRQAIQIAYFEGLSHSQIAERLGVPLGTIKTRIRKGMLRLRDMLESV